jgi:hypothetical protein
VHLPLNYPLSLEPYREDLKIEFLQLYIDKKNPIPNWIGEGIIRVHLPLNYPLSLEPYREDLKIEFLQLYIDKKTPFRIGLGRELSGCIYHLIIH